ncbi:Eco57I restriction-modification methylase domain-containing protein [Lutibacter maritimus]|uniref:site-specific DNA-methyltransferase (adenine-specific) n=1 Tax=Lutibacter maritimus TaxID=593133 RepID=A0A1I6Q0M1_9FLAO|nr:DNA methyltransferase [Lutibacter maritimus]SFS45868.1 TaqI-like C-terminal specificity domain-containing protein [Lutibacter maritimus]
MALYQTSVLKNYLNLQNVDKVSKAYKKYTKYFHNTTIQENIKNSKEEQYQAKFLDELFVNILDYSLNPMPNFNITTEFKNQKGAGKADGAILKENSAIGVIELKGTNTKDLESIRKQAFDYKANQKGCVYVITSNFEKLRFYINDATEFLEFNLFQLAPEEFNLLYLCLQKDNILNNLPLTIKEASLVEEDKITKQFYNDYSVFKRELFRDLVKRNAKRLKQNNVTSSDSQSESYREVDDQKALEKNVKLSLFKKSQKLIDRFLFIFFAEDRDLLPANSTIQILDKWKSDIDFGDERPLYNLFKQYFHFLDEGRKGTTSRAEIYAYNGGLFKPDAILDSLEIDDELLYKHAYKLAKYDFSSQVDVNILGHIFENSLNEIESVNAEIEGGEFDKQTSKRKKDGVFYTPKYITKYIVENTVGKLCQEKKETLGFKEETYFELKKGTHQNTKKQLLDILDTYREWLLQITICDPACGSGAFLNQALDFLIKEHRYIDELKAKVLGGGFILSDIENTILENNIYGVDLNEESVEIAKLSLWLRTAQPRRKLNDLSNNIKCGNSLIDSKAVAGNKAFNWQLQFPQIFGTSLRGTKQSAESKQGFDVVIGNPPYVNANELKKGLSKDQYSFLKSNFATAKGTVDLYIYFFEKGLDIISQKGILSYITPNRFLSASYGKALREMLVNQYEILGLIDYSDKRVFEDASTYPVISFLKKKERENYEVTTGGFDEVSKQIIEAKFDSKKLNVLEDYILGFLLNDKLIITEKIINQSESLENVGKINATSTASEADDYSKLITEDGQGYKLINTGTIDPYCTTWGISELTDKGRKLLKPFLPKESTSISENRHNLYSSPKIIIAKIGLKCEAFYDNKGEYSSINTNCIHSFSEDYLPEYVQCWINSKLYNYMFECFFDGLRMSGGYLLFSAPNLRNTYIKRIPIDRQNQFIQLSEDLQKKNTDFIIMLSRFSTFFSNSIEIEKLTRKLENWHELDFGDFIKELNKAIKKAGGTPLTKKDEFEWLELFEDNKKKAQELQTQITQTEKAIDQMVYKLYNLTPDEIEIIENT